MHRSTRLFEQQILTEPGKRRYVLGTRVSSLAGLLRSVTTAGVALEHVYDY